MIPKNITPTTEKLPFGHMSSGENLFTVQDGIPIQTALEHSSVMMGCASSLIAETDNADPQRLRSLTWASLHFVEMSKALIEASIDGLVGFGAEHSE
ncbi:DUF3077 domain-containing protein [Pseudomonas sp. NA-150]|uniref:DUF3077 domain-containing protein n=1 Tax=Pseudomonas sp. NA-150 TaxID=3367525 RepID=UPI0037C8F2C7